METSITKEFAKRLRGSSILFAVWQGISIPAQLLVASLTAMMLTSALAGDRNAVLRQGGLLLGCILLYKLLEIVLKMQYNRELTKAKQDCRMRLYRWYMENPLHRLYAFAQGKFLERVTDDFSTVTGKFSRWMPLLAVNLLASVVYFLFVCMRSSLLALLFLALALVQAAPELAIRRLEERVYEDNRDVEAEITEWLVAAYRGFSTIKGFRLTGWYMERLKKLHDENVAIGSRASRISAAESSAQQLIAYLLRYGVCVAAGVFALWGRLSLDAAVAAIAISGSFFSAVKALFDAIPEFAVANVAQKRLEEWKEQPEEPRKCMDEKGVRLSEVSFAYGEKQIFCCKSMTLETDGIAVIKGENGCGKSTLLKLIAGLLSCDDGDIAVGWDIAKSQSQLQGGRQILYLSQERLHMDITAEAYIKLFSAADAQALKAHLREFHIEEKLLHSRLNDLSGGEEKKLMMSILLASGAPLILLDEPETSLDVEGQQILVRKLQERGCGVLIVTHSALFDGIADHIYQLKADAAVVSAGEGAEQ